MAAPSSLFNQQRMDHIREPLREQLQGSGPKKHEVSSLGLQIRGHCGLAQRPAYHKEVDTAREELANFREKFDQWKIHYDREIGKTRHELAMLTPRLMGLGLASKIHHLQEMTASRMNTPRSSTPRCSTPRSADL